MLLVLNSSVGAKKVDPNENEKTVIKKVKEGTLQIQVPLE